MLVLTRKPGQTVIIDLEEGVDPRTPVGELFAQGAITVRVLDVVGAQVKLGFEAEGRFRILREELWVRRRAAGRVAR